MTSFIIPKVRFILYNFELLKIIINNCSCCLVAKLCPILVTQIVAHQPPLPMGFPQARILEWVAIPFSRGHLGYFYHLAIGNNAAMNTGESEIAQLYPTLSDPMDCSLPGFSVRGIFQARVPFCSLPQPLSHSSLVL